MKKLRILALVHKHLVPPDDTEGVDVVNAEWKMEYDVDVTLEGELPASARPDLSIDGTIELDRVENALFVGRPGYGAAGQTVGLFRLTPDGRYAERVSVKLGRTSVNHVEILGGLKAGDVIILSDMSTWDQHSRVRLH